METKKILLGGEWREGREEFVVKNPFSGEAIARVFSADAAENEEAVAVAEPDDRPDGEGRRGAA